MGANLSVSRIFVDYFTLLEYAFEWVLSRVTYESDRYCAWGWVLCHSGTVAWLLVSLPLMGVIYHWPGWSEDTMKTLKSGCLCPGFWSLLRWLLMLALAAWIAYLCKLMTIVSLGAFLRG